MPKSTVEQRIAALEADVARLKVCAEETAESELTWLQKAYGAFANDPIYDEAMRLGRAYREATKAKSQARRSR